MGELYPGDGAWVPAGGPARVSVPGLALGFRESPAALSVPSAVASLLSASRRLALTSSVVSGFRAQPNPGWSHLGVLPVVTSAETFVPNKVSS